MAIHHQSHHERIDAELAFDWELIPKAISSLSDLSHNALDVRLLRKGKALRGISSFTNLRRVWAFDVNQELLEELCELPLLEILFIDRVRAGDLSPLRHLKKIRVLFVEGATKATELSWLPAAESLRSLGICNLQALHQLNELEALPQLHALAVEGDVWKPMHVASLTPLSHLRNLCFLSLVNCHVSDRSLRPLHQLNQLAVLHCAQYFPRHEFQLLEAAAPDLRCDWFSSDAWDENAG
jgi:hypothetical protein